MGDNPNILRPLGNSIGGLLTSCLDKTTDVVVNTTCNALGVETNYAKEKRLQNELESMEKENKTDIIRDKIDKIRQKELEMEREALVNKKNNIVIKGEKYNFCDLWFNLGLRNKDKDMPILIDYDVTNICMRFTFEMPVGITKSQIEDKIEEISTFFETHESNIEIRKHKNTIDLIVITCDIFDKVYNYDQNQFKTNEGLKVPLGHFLSDDYKIKLLTTDLSKTGHHAMLIAGMSGFGKSTLLRLILLHLVLNYTPKQLQLVIFAGKGDSDFLFLKDVAPHLYKNKVYINIDDIIGDEPNDKKGIEGYKGVLEELLDEVQERNAIFSSLKCKDIDEYHRKGYNEIPYKVVVFDEYSFYHGDKKFTKLQDTMGSLVQSCRSCGIKVIIALQDAQREYYTSKIKYNTPLKVLFKAENEAHSKNMCNETGLESINRVGEGRFYAPNMPKGRNNIAFKAILPSENTDTLEKMIKERYNI